MLQLNKCSLFPYKLVEFATDNLLQPPSGWFLRWLLYSKGAGFLGCEVVVYCSVCCLCLGVKTT